MMKIQFGLYIAWNDAHKISAKHLKCMSWLWYAQIIDFFYSLNNFLKTNESKANYFRLYDAEATEKSTFIRFW